MIVNSASWLRGVQISYNGYTLNQDTILFFSGYHSKISRLKSVWRFAFSFDEAYEYHQRSYALGANLWAFGNTLRFTNCLLTLDAFDLAFGCKPTFLTHDVSAAMLAPVEYHSVIRDWQRSSQLQGLATVAVCACLTAGMSRRCQPMCTFWPA